MKYFKTVLFILVLLGLVFTACQGNFTTGEIIGRNIVEKNLEIPNRDEGYSLVFKNISFSNAEELEITCANRGKNSVKCKYPEDFDKFDFKIELKGNDIIVSTNREAYYKVEQFSLNIDAKLREVKILGGVPLDLDAKDMPIEHIKIDGASRFHVRNIKGENFSVKLSGAASIELAGECNRLDLNFEGAGEIMAQDLLAKEVDAKLDGAGIMTVSCEEKLNASIDGPGIINYYGSPEVDSKVSIVGKVKQISPNLP